MADTTRSEYAKSRNDHRAFYRLLDALALTHTFLFLGCGLTDPDVRLLLEDSFFRYPMSRAHLMVLPNREVHKDVSLIVEETMNLKLLTYSPANDHKELMDSILQLGILVDAKREELRQSANW